LRVFPCMDTKYVIGAVLFLTVSCRAYDQNRALVPSKKGAHQWDRCKSADA
jgi:hypothetical protein